MNKRLLLAWLILFTAGNLPAENDSLPQLLRLADARRFDAEILAAAAESSHVAIRRYCARILGHLRRPEAARLSLRLAQDRSPGVRAEALASLGRLLPWLRPGPVHERATRTLVASLSHPDPQVRRAAGWAMAAAGVEGNVLLSAIARESDAQVKAVFLQQLWRLSQVNWLPVARRYAQSEDVTLRRAALWSLARASNNETTAALGEALSDPDPQVRRLACEGVRRQRLTTLAKQLLPLAEDPQEEVQVAAMEALAALGSAAGDVISGKFLRGLAQLIGLEDLEHPHVRVAAIRLAGVVGCCRQELVRLVEEGGWLAGEALLALARQGAREQVAAELTSGDAAYRRWATLALAYLTDSGALWRRAAQDPEAAVRLAAAQVAGKMSAKDTVPQLRELLEDADEAVRAQACESLDALGARPDAGTLARLLERALGEGGGDAPITLIRLLGKGPTLSFEAASALEKARLSREFAVAQAAWEELFKHGRVRAFPEGATAKPLSFYQQVARFAASPRYLEVVTVRGTFTVALDAAEAPLTSYAITQLADKKFFDKLTFHRVVSNFVVQGGDPRGDGWGGPGFFLRDELSLGEFAPGSLGLALAGADTGGSQFFVTLTAQPHLDGYYPRLGRVVAGMDVVGRLQQGDGIIRIRAGEGEPPTPIPVWYGPLSWDRLAKTIPEFARNFQAYEPKREWLDLLKQTQNRYTLVVAMGTWCSDSQEQVPRLLKILERLGTTNPFAQVKLLGVDRGKKVVPASAFPYGSVERVPTIVVTLEGAEVGRIVETPLSSSLEEDLVGILAPLEGWEVPAHEDPN